MPVSDLRILKETGYCRNLRHKQEAHYVWRSRLRWLYYREILLKYHVNLSKGGCKVHPSSWLLLVLYFCMYACSHDCTVVRNSVWYVNVLDAHSIGVLDKYYAHVYEISLSL